MHMIRSSEFGLEDTMPWFLRRNAFAIAVIGVIAAIFCTAALISAQAPSATRPSLLVSTGARSYPQEGASYDLVEVDGGYVDFVCGSGHRASVVVWADLGDGRGVEPVTLCGQVSLVEGDAAVATAAGDRWEMSLPG